jgi:retinol dehydrogenase-14
MLMTAKTILITGANSGIGFVAARALAAEGAALLLVCRNPIRGEAALRQISSVATGPEPRLLIADLASQASIRELANEVVGGVERLDVLVNNAGAIFGQRGLTVDGIEQTFAVNHLGPFLLTNLLLAKLKAAAAARVVTVASEAYPSRLDFENLQGERSYNFLTAYMRSKLANIVFSHELAQRLRGSRATANCLSPGPTQTRFGDDLSGAAALFPMIMKRIPGLFAPAERGAQDVVRLASAPELDDVSGQFFFHGQARATKAVTYDPHVATQLWRLSEGLTGLSARSTMRPNEKVPLPAIA